MVHQPQGERGFGADDDQARLFLFRQCEETRDVFRTYGDVSPDLGRARVSGRADDLVHVRALVQLPGQGVLTPAPADNDDFHRIFPLEKGEGHNLRRCEKGVKRLRDISTHIAQGVLHDGDERDGSGVCAQDSGS